MAFLTNPGNPPIKYEEEVLNSDTFPDSESNIVVIEFKKTERTPSSGMTTIETFEKEKIEELVLRGKIRKEDAIFPYNLGTSYKNFREIFNSSEISSIDEKLEKEGYFNNSKEYVYYWPPQEYLNYKLEQNFGIKSERSFKQDINEKKFNLENRKKRNYNRNGNEGLDVLENTLEERNNELEHSLGNTGSPLVTNDVIGFEYDSEEDNEVLGLLKKRILQK
ncbi:hypothetical protein HDU92_001417 [Lobulomyces angularis]|nr:hypothetical protein HDU92_001417 [Lobulomyces angularis]